MRGQQLGSGKAARARELRQQMTGEERLLWDRLRDGKVDGLRFRRQQVIDGFIVDFYCHAAGLVIEVDGSSHDETREADAERDRILQARGLRILRVENAAVRARLTQVVQSIIDAAPRPARDARTLDSSLPDRSERTGNEPTHDIQSSPLRLN